MKNFKKNFRTVGKIRINRSLSEIDETVCEIYKDFDKLFDKVDFIVDDIPDGYRVNLKERMEFVREMLINIDKMMLTTCFV